MIAYFYSDNHDKHYENSGYPSVSFVIACKNEEDSISKTIDTCLESDYPHKLECVVIDDGSTDKTLDAIKLSKIRHGKALKIISFPENLGKREAMAEGVLISSGEIIVFVDSDSFLRKQSLKNIVEHFIADKKIGAVSGNSFVHNAHVNALTKMQSARYGVSFDIFKASESVFGAVTCCPGCFSAYRRQAVLSILPRWRNQTFLGTRSTFGDDRSLTNFVLRTWKVIYCRKAIASTIAPEAYKQFFKQQLRWKKSWVREGANAGSFIWKKNPIASVSFYINLIIPIFGPIIVLKVFLFDFLINHKTPLVFIGGIFFMSLLFGIYYYFIYQNKYWWYTSLFTLMYTFILIWQMPYALLKLNDTRWGTR